METAALVNKKAQKGQGKARLLAYFKKDIRTLLKDISSGLMDLGGDMAFIIMLFVLSIVITALMSQVAVLLFSSPGLVEWIAYNVFAQNCVNNGVCDFGSNMAAFAITNIIGAELITVFMMGLMNLGVSHEEQTDEALTRIENTATYAVDRINALEGALEKREVIRKDIPANS